MARRSSLLLLALLALGCERSAEREQRALAAASRAENEGDRSRATSLLADALRADPRQLRIVERLAEVLLADDRAPAAAHTLDALPSDVPVDDAFRRLRARVQLRRGNCREGIALARALVRDEAPPADGLLANEVAQSVATSWPGCEQELTGLPAAWLLQIARHLLEERMPAAAAAAWQLLAPDDAERPLLAERIVEQLLREPAADQVADHPDLVGPPLSAAKLLLAHRSALFAGRYAEAATAELTFARLFPQAVGSYEMMLALARRQSRQGDRVGALSFANRALALNPAGLEALVERGLALDALGRERDARSAFGAVLALDPRNALARRYLAAGDPATVHLHPADRARGEASMP